jgi:hypothetical protein
VTEPLRIRQGDLVPEEARVIHPAGPSIEPEASTPPTVLRDGGRPERPADVPEPERAVQPESAESMVARGGIRSGIREAPMESRFGQVVRSRGASNVPQSDRILRRGEIRDVGQPSTEMRSMGSSLRQSMPYERQAGGVSMRGSINASGLDPTPAGGLPTGQSLESALAPEASAGAEVAEGAEIGGALEDLEFL